MRRLEIRVGKMSLPDVLDLNGALSDSHLQFTNWTIDNNGAWDYAADTRGYTYAATVEYQDRHWALRYGLALMPTIANGIALDWNLRRARGQNMEMEWRNSLLRGREGTQRVLVFTNNAHMGNYREAVNAFVSGQDAKPDITKHEHYGTPQVRFRLQLRAGCYGPPPLGRSLLDGMTAKKNRSLIRRWNQTALVGGDYDGAQWHRKHDRLGVAFVTNAIKRDHQHYLANGGFGFLLGDGHLHYGRETPSKPTTTARLAGAVLRARALSHRQSWFQRGSWSRVGALTARAYRFLICPKPQTLRSSFLKAVRTFGVPKNQPRSSARNASP